MTYSTQDVLDYLEGNFVIPEDGFETSRDLKVKVMMIWSQKLFHMRTLWSQMMKLT